ncbi:MAG TPA: glycerate kinase [Pseudosphingobacterium sp.]|nr:glycerate kinase [Pseudosphingobacterium sp.]
MQILIAPNAFKNSLPADKAAQAIAAGLTRSKLDCTITNFPIGDGGDGTMEILRSYLKLETVNLCSSDPLGRPIESTYGYRSSTHTAFIEMADTAGIRLLEEQELNPMKTSSIGTGKVILDALNRGARHIVLGVGGSATVDGGCGIMAALGVKFKNGRGGVLGLQPESLQEVEEIDFSSVHERLKYCSITVLSDVNNKLLGINGAAFVFGPQKGATADQVEQLDDFLERLNCRWITHFGKDASKLIGGGAAGGVAAGLWAMAGASLVSGIDYFLEAAAFDEKLKSADLVITGEGALDEQTLEGKGPYGVAVKAKEIGVPVIGIAGKVPLEHNEQLSQYFDEIIPISHMAASFSELRSSTYENLVRTGKLIGDLLCIGKKL